MNFYVKIVINSRKSETKFVFQRTIEFFLVETMEVTDLLIPE